MSRELRFLLVGAWNTLWGYLIFAGLYALLLPLGVNYIAVLVASQILAVTSAYLCYKWGVFKTKGYGLREYLRFWTVYLYTFAANLVLLPLCVRWLGLNPLLAQGIIALLCALAGYLGHSRFTFQPAAADQAPLSRANPR